MILENIQKRRKALSLTQSELAKLSGVSQSTITKIERGRMSPSFESAKKIFDVLDQLEQKTSGKASDIMTKKVITVKPSDNVDEAITLMRKYNISQIPVLENKNIIGLISERSIMGHINEEGLGTQKIKTIMEETPPRIAENTPIKLVSELLKYNSILVVTKKAEITGVIARSDLFKIIYS